MDVALTGVQMDHLELLACGDDDNFGTPSQVASQVDQDAE